MSKPTKGTVSVRFDFPHAIDDALESAAYHGKTTKKDVAVKAIAKHLKVVLPKESAA